MVIKKRLVALLILLSFFFTIIEPIRFTKASELSTGCLLAWGYNGQGQLGDGTNTNKNIPTRIGTETNWLSISSGDEYCIALKTDGSLWSWGNNEYGKLGNGTNVYKNVPTKIGTDTNWKSVSAGCRHSLAIKTDGSLWAWGYNGQGELGDGTNINKNIPTRIGADTNWQSISSGANHSIAIKTDGSLWAWGANNGGQLGDGTYISRNTPIRIGTGTNWGVASSRYYYSMAIKTDGSLWAWGYNCKGELGDGTNIDKNIPVRIGTDTNWRSIALGAYHSLAIKTDGSLWAWGYNEIGQLGDGTNINKSSPIRIGTDTNWKTVTCGFHSSFAVKTDGSLWAWGANMSGQLGDGTNISRNTPTRIGTGTNWGMVSAGLEHTIAITKTNVTTPTITGLASELKIPINDQKQQTGTIDTSGKNIEKVSFSVENWYAGLDGQGVYKTFTPNSTFFALKNFTINTLDEPFNKEGAYIVNIWVKVEGQEAQKLGSFNVIVTPKVTSLTTELKIPIGGEKQQTGMISTSGKNIEKVSFSVKDWSAGLDGKGLYKTFTPNSTSFQLSDLTISTVEAPFNKEGSYLVNIWTKVEGVEAQEIGSFTVVVEPPPNSWSIVYDEDKFEVVVRLYNNSEIIKDNYYLYAVDSTGKRVLGNEMFNTWIEPTATKGQHLRIWSLNPSVANNILKIKDSDNGIAYGGTYKFGIEKCDKVAAESGNVSLVKDSDYGQKDLTIKSSKPTEWDISYNQQTHEVEAYINTHDPTPIGYYLIGTNGKENVLDNSKFDTLLEKTAVLGRYFRTWSLNPTVNNNILNINPLIINGVLNPDYTNVGIKYGMIYNFSISKQGTVLNADYSKNVEIVSHEPIPKFTYKWIDGRTVEFNASTSSICDPGDSISDYYWSFGDGTSESVTSSVKQHIYQGGQNNYTVKLCVKSQIGNNTSKYSDGVTLKPIPIIIVPGTMGSQLVDKNNNYHIVWLDKTDVRSDIEKLYLNENGISIETGIIDYGTLPYYYDNIVIYLRNQGYIVETFSYDWRLDIDKRLYNNNIDQPITYGNADKLRKFIDDEKIKWGADQVDLVAHSQGGLVAKTYLYNALKGDYNLQKTTSVRKFIAIATPQLGTPNAFIGWKDGQLEPSNVLSTSDAWLPNDKVMNFVEHAPAFYAMFPSRKYFNIYQPYYIRNDGVKFQPEYDELIKNLEDGSIKNGIGNWVNSNLLDAANALHDGIDKFDILTNSNFDGYVIAGQGQVNAMVWNDLVVYDIYNGVYQTMSYPDKFTSGDGTIPTFSATDGKRVGTNKIFYVRSSNSHCELLNDLGIQRTVYNIIKEKDNKIEDVDKDNIQCTPFNDPSGWCLRAACPVDLIVKDSTDEVGTKDNPITKNITTWYYGEGKTAFVQDSKFEINLKGTGVGLSDVVLEKYENGAVAERRIFFNIPVNEKSNAMITAINNEVSTFKLDLDGDGTYEQVKEPDCTSSGLALADTMLPVINANLDGTLFNHDVSISVSATDDTEVDKVFYSINGQPAVGTPNNSSVSFTSDGSYNVKFVAMDKAGNLSIAKELSFTIDKTAPAIEIQGIKDGDAYILNQKVTSSWTVNDTLSGVDNITATLPNGLDIDTSVPGSHQYTIKATDKAGNVSEKVITYYVKYDYSGVLQPISISGTSVFKLGSTIPVKFTLKDANMNYIGNAIANISVSKFSDTVIATGEYIEVPTVTVSFGNEFRYDSTDNQYIYNLSTKNFTEGQYLITIKLNDGQSYSTKISLK